MAQAAEQLPTGKLFEHLVDIERAQLTATERLATHTLALDTSGTP